MGQFIRGIEFQPTEMKVGSGWYVQVVLPKGKSRRLGGFKTESEAKDWISHKAAEWLKEFESGRNE